MEIREAEREREAALDICTKCAKRITLKLKEKLLTLTKVICQKVKLEIKWL